MWRQNTDGCRGQAVPPRVARNPGVILIPRESPTDEGTGGDKRNYGKYESCGQAS